MDIKEIILQRLKKNKEVKISEIVKKTGFLVNCREREKSF